MSPPGSLPRDLPRPVRERLGRLAPDQREAAIAAPGPVLCVAPAGSGKTTTLVARIAVRVARGVAPASICALTFNRRAADELQARADEALRELGVAPASVSVRTFHALGRDILADGGVDVTRIIERRAVLAELTAGELTAAGYRWLDDAFTRLKLDPERGPGSGDSETLDAFAAYQRHLHARAALDLDDLVARAGPTLQGDAGLLARWRRRCRVLFVDEAQDLDRAQLELALLLTGEERDIFLVGDDDQTIYAWRLADVRRVLGLAARLPGLRRVDLQTNHRCAPEIVRRAARLVAHNEERFEKRILPSPTAGGSLTLVPDPGDEVARARWLLGSWAAQHPGERTAVLARTNRELAPIAAVALELGVPHQVGVDGLLLDLEPVGHVLEDLARSAEPELPLLAGLRAAAARLAMPTDLTASLLAWAAPYGRLDLLEAAVRTTAERQRRLVTEEAPLTLATMHGTKGLEWDHVACIGHDEGAFPSGRALREAAEPRRVLEEERRLAYVAWTRARITLTIVYDPGAPSVFIREAFDAHELP